MRKYILPIAAAAALLGASSAFAAQTSANFQVRVNIQTACTVSATALNFGNVGVISGAETAASNVSVNCSNGTPYWLSLGSDPLIANQVTAITGTMTNAGLPGEVVNYSAALSSSGGTGSGAAQAYTIDGTLPAQATPTPALYTDNKTLYVNY